MHSALLSTLLVAATATTLSAQYFAPYGSGCATPNGVAQISNSTLPVLGQVFDFRLSNGPSNGIAFLLIGASDSTYLGATLPLDLAALGSPGCLVLASAEFNVAAGTDAFGSAAASVPIPPWPELNGIDLYHQWLAFYPSVFQIATSDAAKAEVGQSMYGVNLIWNGDAERDLGATDGSDVAVSGWIEHDNRITAQQYNGFSVDDGWTVPPGHGANYFYGGMNYPDPFNSGVSMTSRIAIGNEIADIDAGRVDYTLAGEFGGWRHQNDKAELIATFLDASGTVLLPSPVTIGGFDAVARGSLSMLLPDSTSGTLPAGTRSIGLEVRFTKEAGGIYNDGAADNLSLVLTRRP